MSSSARAADHFSLWHCFPTPYYLQSPLCVDWSEDIQYLARFIRYRAHFFTVNSTENSGCFLAVYCLQGQLRCISTELLGVRSTWNANGNVFSEALLFKTLLGPCLNNINTPLYEQNVPYYRNPVWTMDPCLGTESANTPSFVTFLWILVYRRKFTKAKHKPQWKTAARASLLQLLG